MLGNRVGRNSVELSRVRSRMSTRLNARFLPRLDRHHPNEADETGTRWLASRAKARWTTVVTVVALLHPVICAVATEAARTDAVNFGREILPIFSNNCYHCHGPDEQERKAKLRLDTREGVLGAGKSGAIAVITAARFGRPTRVSVRSCSFRGHSRPWPTRHARAIQRGEDPIRFS